MAPKGAVRNGAAKGSLVIAGADPTFRRRLLQSLSSEPHSRRISDVGARPDLEQHVASLLPSVILFDLGAKPDPRTLGIVSALSALAKTIVLADGEDEALAVEALKAGASGFCSRGTTKGLIWKAVQLVEAGEIWVGRGVMLRLIEELATLRAQDSADRPGEECLTSREREIAALVARGAGNKQIAHRLSISIKTVKAHLTTIFKKLGLSTRLQLGLALGRAPAPQTKVG
jgi:DNA-binding NarL/FixJ family response regulator